MRGNRVCYSRQFADFNMGLTTSVALAALSFKKLPPDKEINLENKSHIEFLCPRE